MRYLCNGHSEMNHFIKLVLYKDRHFARKIGNCFKVTICKEVFKKSIFIHRIKKVSLG